MALNSNQVKSLQAGTHADADGLYLIVRDTGDRAWAFRFTDPKGKRAQMEFAKVGDRDSPDKLTLTLSTARETARDFKVALKRHGIDPRFKKQAAAKGTMTFKDYAEQKYPGWCVGKSADEEKQWVRSIRDVPSLHALRPHEIDVSHILDALKPIWWEKPITADRTRQRIEKLLDAAKVEKLRTGDNPATWRGNLKFVLPAARKLNKKKAHPSVPYAKAPALMMALRYDTGMVARCVEIGILTVARSQEIRLMEWTEIDFAKKTWLCPAEKMKIKGDDEPKDHLVPLSDQAIAIIRSLPNAGRYVFPSDHADDHAPFLPNALTNCIKRAGFKGTMHGMRSTFRNWGGDDEAHNFRREVLEHCLAHREGSETEASYWTGEMRERRRVVLQAWADYVMPVAKAAKSRKPSLTLVA
jgi:integrase